MAQKTILQIAQVCAQRLLWQPISTFIGSTDNNLILLLAMINRTIEEESNEYSYPELVKEYAFDLHANQPAYPLPADYDMKEDDTLWNQSQHWPLMGPITPVMWQQYKSGFITTLPRQRFRVKGVAINQFFIDPTPSTSEDAQTCVFEYYSSTMIKAAVWTANTVIALNAYRSYNGNTYKCTANGTTSSTVYAIGPTVVNGKAIDNTVGWTFVPTWVTITFYNVGDYVNLNSKIYKCTVAGVTGGTGPSHTSGSATDGTVTWLWVSTPSAWVVGTTYTKDSSYVTANSKFYRCTTTGISGTIAPNFTYNTQIDGTVTWTYQDTYNDFTADTDIVLLDSQLIIDGTVWRVLQDRGFAWEETKRTADEQKQIIQTKLEGSSVISISGRNNLPWAIGLWSTPEGNYGL